MSIFSGVNNPGLDIAQFTSAEIAILIALASGGVPILNEVVSGSGTSWTLANTPVAGTVQLYANGQRLIVGSGNDYTISGTNITTTNSWVSGTVLADYYTLA